MDVLFFLKERTRLIRQYYDSSARPFTETMRKIEEQEEPFVPPYSEDCEPAFLNEWIEAKELLEITGRCCISMLSTALDLYFKTWDRELKLHCGQDFKKFFKDGGLVGGYRACIAMRLDLNWGNCPADLTIIEQIVLARNLDQHPEHIDTIRVPHSKHDLVKYRHPFFLNENETGLLSDPDYTNPFSMLPNLHISGEKLMKAIEQVEVLCEWLENQMFDAKYPHRKKQN